MTQTVTPAPLSTHSSRDTRRPERSRAWAGTGLAAAIAAGVCLGAQTAVTAVFDPAISGDATKVAADLAQHKPALAVFHAGGAACAVLLMVFAAGLHRRLRQTLPADSLAPVVAALGVAVTAMVMVMGTALDTEFGIFVQPAGQVPAEHVSFYGHWTGTVPSVWTALGMAGLAVFVAWRRGGVSRAQGLTGLVLGGLTVLVGVSPATYVSVLPGVAWLLAASLMFLVGDKAHRTSR